MDPSFKKRHRIPASCSVCRKRKSKCDRIRPVCGSCKKKSIAHLCYYENENGESSGPPNGYNALIYDQHEQQQQQLFEQQARSHQYPPQNSPHQPPPPPGPPQQLQQQKQPVPPHFPYPPAPNQPMYVYLPPGMNNGQQAKVGPAYSPPAQLPQSHISVPSPVPGPVPNSFQQSPPQIPQQSSPHAIKQPESQPQPLQQQQQQQQSSLMPSQPFRGPSQPQQLPLPPTPNPIISALPRPSSLHGHSTPNSRGSLQHSIGTPQTPHQPPQIPMHLHHQLPNEGNRIQLAPLQRENSSDIFRGDPSPTSRAQSITTPSATEPKSSLSGKSSGMIPPSEATKISPTIKNTIPVPIADPTSAPRSAPLPASQHHAQPPLQAQSQSPQSSVIMDQFSHDFSCSNAAAISIVPPKSTSPPPTPEDEAELVSIVIGPNSTLKVNPHDTMDVFANASFSLVIDGPNWQQHGPISYTGLTKSDPFIKYFRSYAISLFKSGELSKYLLTKYSKSKKRSNKHGKPSSKRAKAEKSASMHENLMLINAGAAVKQETANNHQLPLEEPTPKEDTQMEDDEEEEEEGDGEGEGEGEPVGGAEGEDDQDLTGLEDTLIVSKINMTKEAKAKKDAEANVKVNLPDTYAGIKTLNGVKNTQEDFYNNIVFKSALQVLPSQRCIFILFYRFFKYVYPFIPVVDENCFLMDLNKLFPEKFPRFSMDKYKEIKLDHPNELNTLAILLLVLRLGYMSMIHNDDVNNDYTDHEKIAAEEMKQISSEEYGKVISLCIPDEQTLSKSSFKLVQALTLLYFYKQVAPDDCHGLSGSDAQLLLGVIVRHSITIGLNRDPKMYFSHVIRKREPLMACWRNLWHYIVITDATTSIHCGTALNLRSLEISDVEPPQYKGKSGELDELYSNINMINESYRKLSNKITNVRNKPKVVSILEETNELEKIFFKLFGKDFFKDYICLPIDSEDDGDDEVDMNQAEDHSDGENSSMSGGNTTGSVPHSLNDDINYEKNKGTPSTASSASSAASSTFGYESRTSSTSTATGGPAANNLRNKYGNGKKKTASIPGIKHEYSYIKVIKFITFIQLRTNLSCMYYMIAVHYENKYNESKTPSMSAGIELFKIYIKSVVQLVYIMSYVLDHSVELFGKNYDYILTAVNERCMIKTHSFLTSFFVRLLHHIKDLTVKREKAQNPNEIDEINMRLGVLHNLLQIVLIESELFVGNFKKLSRKYINSYRIYVMLFLVLRQCMSNPAFFFENSQKYESLQHDGTNMLQFFTLNELEQVSNMCEEFRTAKEEQNKIYKRDRKRSNLSSDLSNTSSQDIPVQMDSSYSQFGKEGDLGFANGIGSGSGGGKSKLGAGTPKQFGSVPMDHGAFSSIDGGETVATTNSNVSTSSQSPYESVPSIYSALNNFILGDNPMSQNDDFIRLFDVYNDLEHESYSM